MQSTIEDKIPLHMGQETTGVFLATWSQNPNITGQSEQDVFNNNKIVETQIEWTLNTLSSDPSH